LQLPRLSARSAAYEPNGKQVDITDSSGRAARQLTLGSESEQTGRSSDGRAGQFHAFLARAGQWAKSTEALNDYWRRPPGQAVPTWLPSMK